MGIFTEATGIRVRRSMYATVEDFRALFEARSTEFYQLALLLTNSSEKAEECLHATFEDCTRDDSVFKEWAHSWCRCAIIRIAVRIMKLCDINRAAPPGPDQGKASFRGEGEEVDFAGVPGWNLRERFIFVLSSLEHFSDQAAAVLLRCSPREGRDAKKRVFCHIVDGCGSLTLMDELDRIICPKCSQLSARLNRSSKFVGISNGVAIRRVAISTSSPAPCRPE